jgi:crotonobetainyl-CoA:carnitine CoA-transferase CaiB-like acyl-CoA transferase
MVEPVAPRVLDSTTGIAGAYAALLLHQAGAEVVRSVGDRDDLELASGAPLTTYLRQGQGCVRHDGTSASDVGADVWLVTPGPDERADVRAAADADAGLIVAAITPYGLDGPYADRPASDLTIQAESGALAVRGTAGQEPIQMGGRTEEWLGGAYAAAAALAYWRRRRAGGDGALIDVSLAEVGYIGAANFMDVFIAVEHGPDAEASGIVPRAYETPSIERTADGWVGFNTNAPHQITGFLRMIGRDDLAESGEFMMVGARLARRAEWQEMVTAWTSTRSTAEIIDAAVVHNVPVAPVCNGRTVAELDQVVARGSLGPSPDGSFVMPGRAWRVDGDRGPTPRLPDATVRDAPGWSARAEPSEAGSAPVDAAPLAGLRVLDLTAWWAGPSATGVLAALGADVIHVEGPARMDGMRMVGMMFGDRSNWWELSPFFVTINTNKRDVAIDFTGERGRDLVLRLLEHADVVVENFTPRVLTKIGLDWETIHAANPRAVLVRMPAFGLDGPWRDRPGFAQNIEQASGLAWITGQPDDQPRIQRGPCDPNGGMHAVIGLLEALDRRDDTGVGSMVEVSLFDAALALASEAIIEWSAHGVLREREGNRSPLSAPQGVYRARDEDAWVALSVETDEQWTALADLIGPPAAAADPSLADLAGRRARHDELDAAIGAWIADVDGEDAVAQLLAVGIPAGIAFDPRRVAKHPQFQARGFHELVDHPVAGPLPLPVLPFRVTGVDRWTRTPAPCFGEHTEAVLTELLGLTAEDLVELRADGTVADRPVGL